MNQPTKPFQLKASQRLKAYHQVKAAKADTAKAGDFLRSLGIKNYKQIYSANGQITFTIDKTGYEASKKALMSQYHSPDQNENTLEWNLGKGRSIVLSDYAAGQFITLHDDNNKFFMSDKGSWRS